MRVSSALVPGIKNPLKREGLTLIVILTDILIISHVLLGILADLGGIH